MDKPRLTADMESKLVNGILAAKRGLAIIDTIEQCGRDCQYTRQRAAESVERAQRILDNFGSGKVGE